MSTAYRVSKREIVPALIPGFCAIALFGILGILVGGQSAQAMVSELSLKWRIFVTAVCLSIYSLTHALLIRYHNIDPRIAMQRLRETAIVVLRMDNEHEQPGAELNPETDRFGIRRIPTILLSPLEMLIRNSLEGFFLFFLFFIGTLLFLTWILFLSYKNAGAYLAAHLFGTMLLSVMSVAAYRVYSAGRIYITPLGLIVEKGIRAIFYPWSSIESVEWDKLNTGHSYLKLTRTKGNFWFRSTIGWSVEIITLDDQQKLFQTLSSNVKLTSKPEESS